MAEPTQVPPPGEGMLVPDTPLPGSTTTAIPIITATTANSSTVESAKALLLAAGLDGGEGEGEEEQGLPTSTSTSSTLSNNTESMQHSMDQRLDDQSTEVGGRDVHVSEMEGEWRASTFPRPPAAIQRIQRIQRSSPR